MVTAAARLHRGLNNINTTLNRFGGEATSGRTKACSGGEIGSGRTKARSGSKANSGHIKADSGRTNPTPVALKPALATKPTLVAPKPAPGAKSAPVALSRLPVALSPLRWLTLAESQPQVRRGSVAVEVPSTSGLAPHLAFGVFDQIWGWGLLSAQGNMVPQP
jgi:hypothetical protein